MVVPFEIFYIRAFGTFPDFDEILTLTLLFRLCLALILMIEGQNKRVWTGVVWLKNTLVNFWGPIKSGELLNS